ncbi:MFS transporter [Streptomyces tsukubensis]|uniref:MFS transporter n=1 Tax=Streptomyces tsukubensis TaxID=83656 RepID=A0A1V4A260_9ACTN|nr:MFS transporter [Streptomyces tsukubensis]OON72917.1 MFS transporter [Streptomyces tsukubensis]QFR94481.1 MFS transporter [Streptomyces tsukubensis]
MAKGAATPGGRVRLGRRFEWLWAAYAVSTFGTWIAFDAFPLIAVLVLHAGPMQVSALAAAGLAVGALVAVPLGPWVEFRRKRPVMIAMDLVRFAALISVVLAYVLGLLGFVQLLIASIAVSAADLTFRAASGAAMKALVAPEHLLVANARFESTMWTASVAGPPLGGAAIGVFGPMVTLAADGVSYLLSAVGIRAIGGKEQKPAHVSAPGLRVADLSEGWRYILHHRTLRPLFLNTLLNNSLIMAIAPVLAVLMLGRLGFAPWQYALAFATPCVGGLVGSRLSPGLVARFGRRKVMFVSGTLRACWLPGLVFIRPGAGGLVLVIVVELGLITCSAVFNPVSSTYRLERTPDDRIARTLSAWSVTSKLCTAGMTALWGVLASATGPRPAIAIAGLLSLATPFLLPRGGEEGDRVADEGKAGRDSNLPDSSARTPLP